MNDFKSVYIACAMTNVPSNVFADYNALIRSIARKVSASGFGALYAFEHSDPELARKPARDRPEICYKMDREMVLSASFLIAEASFPSLGVGIELEIAASAGIPIMIIHSAGWRTIERYGNQYKTDDGMPHRVQIGKGGVSLMALGLPTVILELSYSTNECGYLLDSISLTLRKMIQK